MKKTILSAALLLSAALTAAASDQSNKPSASQATTAQQAGHMAVQTPFTLFVDGNWIFVMNKGDKDWAGALDVWATCKPVAPTETCDANFAGGKYHAGHYDKGTFPKGFGPAVAPIKGSANAQQVSGYGWVAVLLGLPPGSYKVTATAANNSSPETNVTIAAPPSGNTVRVQPGVVPVVAPTKTP